ncbi:polyprenol monophosphomannose synthase [Psychroflexus planctonicus]|uniref:Dolichol-phosphate mannosyltransferase n=1 Tax=Psychroflexus planctonicus TaxID=1526575 RepID=A0ABQ1SJ39_9FLAO|nr:polyprenol monophosphomannose synthase [Psychroflexus planctonicus]GGE38822.1 dolichol-phosphate mannosyltransferase [Psychroflexus planctonicus]
MQKFKILNLVVIPTYNEYENISKIINGVLSRYEDFHILVVDDNSPDGTGELVEKLIAEKANFERLHLLKRAKKEGLGVAYISGFRWALQRNYEYIFEMDADFSHHPKDLKQLLSACRDEGYDMSIGSRYVKGVNVVNWPMKRILISWFASKYVKFLMRIPINDSTAGYVCYRKEVLEKINLDKIQFIGYAFQIEMKFKALALGFQLKEVPVIFTERKHGKSKMDGRIIYEAVFGVIKLKLKSIFGKIQ